jgi:O-succinylbenzoate synthase
MRINKQKVALYEAFNDGMRAQIRKSKMKEIEDLHIGLNAEGRLASEFRRKHREIRKTVEDMEKKYELNEDEQQYYDENVRDKS